jgi:O-antigen/teichoic acid export membrane protein
MASIETAPLLEGKTGTAPAEVEKIVGWKASAIAGDIATLGAGTALAAAFNTMLVFLIPRLMSVEEYGHWRLFLLYAGYVGFLHFGFADGALLRWAGRTQEAIYHEVGPSWRYLILLHLAVVIPLCAMAGLAPGMPTHIRILCVGVLLFGLIINSVTLLQYSLQAARVFRPVAIAAAVPPGVFVVLAFCWSLRSTPTANELMALYGVSWVVVLIYLFLRVRPRLTSSSGSARALGKESTALGWPILLANVGFGLVQSADRLVVSSARPIYDFAQYSLAASTMFAPVAAIAAVYRVFFSHVAAVEHEGRARVYGRASRFLLLAWSLLLPYYFVLEVFVRRFLPKYIPALPLAGILLFGVIFLAEIQILHMSFSYLHRQQREFLLLTIGAFLVTLSMALIITLERHSLAAVAVGQVAALALWWVVNEWTLRETTGQVGGDWLRALVVVVWSAASFAIVLRLTTNGGWRIAAYYLLVAGVLWPACGAEFRFGWGLLEAHRLSIKFRS